MDSTPDKQRKSWDSNGWTPPKADYKSMAIQAAGSKDYYAALYYAQRAMLDVLEHIDEALSKIGALP